MSGTPAPDESPEDGGEESGRRRRAREGLSGGRPGHEHVSALRKFLAATMARSVGFVEGAGPPVSSLEDTRAAISLMATAVVERPTIDEKGRVARQKVSGGDVVVTGGRVDMRVGTRCIQHLSLQHWLLLRGRSSAP